MARRQKLDEALLLPQSPLLITEREEDFNRIDEALDQEIKPRGFIERTYVADIAQLDWETIRLRRCKSGIINSAFRDALKDLLEQVLCKPGESRYSVKEEADKLAYEWFTDPAAKRRVSELLKRFRLDDSAIEAEAMRRVSTDLEMLDRMLASAESRRNRALRNLAEYRHGLFGQARNNSARIIDGKVLALEHPASKRPPTVA
jgi:hypothetical protein